MSDIAIRVEGLSKQYRIGTRQERYRTIRDTLSGVFSGGGTRKRRGKKEIVWALKDLSFEVRRGECVGIIGRNGAGKSTLLKILSRITEPSTGYARIYGRVGSLLEVGTGFHPELTGRDNIHLNGAILGMRRHEIARQFDEIVGFAEVERFIDTPVKHYSSGMYLRLAFAVAAHLEPEILLVDEVLAVGDVAFQKKCLGKMGEVARGGKTVIFVSHDMRAILRLCGQGILLRNGGLERSGIIGGVVDAYLDSAPEPLQSEQSVNRSGDGAVRITRARFRNANGKELRSVSSGDLIFLDLDYESRVNGIRPDSLDVDVTFRDVLQHPVFTVSTRFARIIGVAEFPKTGTLRCQIESLALVDGRYDVDVWVRVSNGVADMVRQAATIGIMPNDFFGTGESPVARKHGSLLMGHSWSLAQSPDVPLRMLATSVIDR